MGSVIYIPKKDNPIFYPEYGALYNWYAATDSRKITSSDNFVIPTLSQWNTLINYLGGSAVAGGKLKETGLIYWSSPNTGATNEVGFNVRGGGYRAPSTGTYSDGLLGTTTKAYYFASDYSNGGKLISHNDSKIVTVFIGNVKNGLSIRLLKTSTTLSHGQIGSYTGNDGKVYPTICIGTQEWLADNLCETKFRNGDIIPWHGATPASYFTNAEWRVLTTAGVCAYDNTLSNVATGFTFPT